MLFSATSFIFFHFLRRLSLFHACFITIFIIISMPLLFDDTLRYHSRRRCHADVMRSFDLIVSPALLLA